MNAGSITQEALNDYRSAIKSWLTLRNTQSTCQLRLAALLDTEEKPAAYASQLEDLRERLAVLDGRLTVLHGMVFMLTRLCWRVVLQAQRKTS